ncbi:hypothetical protein Hanom_Chr16g01504061 [Helianthus anomalus]
MATFFDEATVGLIGIQCRDMISQHGYTDHFETPEPRYKAIGKEVTMQVQYAVQQLPTQVFSPSTKSSTTRKTSHPDPFAYPTNNTFYKQKVGPRIK